MLETVREFALEQLATSGEEAAIRARHAAWCLALAEASELYLRAQAAWLARLDAELDNLRAALAWFDAAGEPINVLRLLAATYWYWGAGPYNAEVRGWLEPALRAAPTLPPLSAWRHSTVLPVRPSSSATRRPPSPMPRKG
jgi:predicted ATPase